YLHLIYTLRHDVHLLSLADLPEGVQQSGVAELAQLLAGELVAAIKALRRLVHHGRQTHGHVGDAPGMAERGRVALLDGAHGGLYEPLEQTLDLAVQLAVLDRHRRLARQGRDQLDGALRE